MEDKQIWKLQVIRQNVLQTLQCKKQIIRHQEMKEEVGGSMNVNSFHNRV